MKARLLLTTTLFMFAQMPAPQAQATVDVSKITCEDYFMDKITFSQYIVMWLNGYYNGKRNNTIIDPDVAKKNEEKVNRYSTNTAKQRSWMPSRTCSAMINEFTQPLHHNKNVLPKRVHSTKISGAKPYGGGCHG